MLNNRYTIIRTLGQGGWGTVSLATDAASGAPVAVKQMNPRLVTNRADIDAEINALRTLDHPNVVRYLDSFDDGDHIHVVTEYIEGQTLERRRGSESLPLRDVERYAGQVLEALEHIHSRGIIHSDLKPENIIIDNADAIHIIDFGIARTPSAQIASDIKEIRGTLHYMSPEQAEGRPFDVRSDLFSLGVILYELCTGKMPFDGDYDMAVIYAILYEDPVSPDKLNGDISPGLAGLILDLLAKNPSNRPGSAIAVKDRLQGAFAPTITPLGPTTARIAVLSFDYPANDSESRLIADGLRDELGTRLRQISELDVVSPIRVAQLASQLTDGRAMRDLLGADTFLTGTIRKSGSQIRIYLMLIASADDSVRWSDKYDIPLSDLFGVIDIITEKVIMALVARLSPHPLTPSPASSTASPAAYELYLLARSYYVKNTRDDLEFARKMYLETLKLDPQYAPAHVGLADCYCQEYMDYYDRRDEVIRRAMELARQALTLAPNLPEAYRTLGRIFQATGKVKEASLQFLKAVTYKEDYYQAYRSLGWLSKDCFRYDEALGWVRKSLSINSTDLETIFLKGVVHFEQRESIAAANDFTRCLELRPDYGRAHCFIGMTYFQLGRIDQAIGAMKQAMHFGGDPNPPYLLGYYYMVQKDYSRSREILLQAATQPEIAFLAHYHLGMLDMLCGNARSAAGYFESSIAFCRRFIELDPEMAVSRAVLIRNLAFLGLTEECHYHIRELLPFAAHDGSVFHDIATAYATLGEDDKALEYIRAAVSTVQGPTAIEITLDPVLGRFGRMANL